MNRRTRALDIPKKVKDKVFARDGGLCVLCSSAGLPNAHFVPRSQGGLGIEENILTLCPECHRRYDQTTQRNILKRYLADYLRGKYKGWDDISLTYKKEIL